ncbi:hypothetical protein Scep_019624 [Stephania cephalantha]|uniref:Uncharacterized protein n=1 Tax=Stephania cephalantha TaxID=152367 RepID=A0AAP0NNH6_9MAGN
MFVPRPPSVNLPPYYFDPYAPGPSSSYVDHGMPHPQMYPSLPQYMPSPYTPTLILTICHMVEIPLS